MILFNTRGLTDRFYLVGGIHTVQVKITDHRFLFYVHAHESHDYWKLSTLLAYTNFFFKNDILVALAMVQRKTALSHKMVMFPFAECTVHCLDSS